MFRWIKKWLLKRKAMKVAMEPWTQDELNFMKICCAYCETEEHLRRCVEAIKRYEWRQEHDKLDENDAAAMWELVDSFDLQCKFLKDGYIELDEDNVPIDAKEPFRNFILTLDGKEFYSFMEELNNGE